MPHSSSRIAFLVCLAVGLLPGFPLSAPVLSSSPATAEKSTTNTSDSSGDKTPVNVSESKDEHAVLPIEQSAIPGPSTSTAKSAAPRSLIQVQAALKSCGFDPGKIDGNMGNKTHAAIKAFQIKKGIEATGALDPGTEFAIFEAVPRPYDAPADIDTASVTAAVEKEILKRWKGGGWQVGFTTDTKISWDPARQNIILVKGTASLTGASARYFLGGIDHFEVTKDSNGVYRALIVCKGADACI